MNPVIFRVNKTTLTKLLFKQVAHFYLILPLIKAPLMHQNTHINIFRSMSLYLFWGFLRAHTCKTFVCDCKLGVTFYILLYEPVLRGADKSSGVDVWSTERDREHTVWGLWDLSSIRSLRSGLSITSSDPCYYLGGWVDHNNMPLLIKTLDKWRFFFFFFKWQ